MRKIDIKYKKIQYLGYKVENMFPVFQRFNLCLLHFTAFSLYFILLDRNGIKNNFSLRETR